MIKLNPIRQIFSKIIILMIVEDLVWWSVGRYSNLSWWQIIPIIFLVALLFTYWIAKTT